MANHITIGAGETDPSLTKQLQDYRLTTAEILYHMPDHPALLQSYIWQELDIAPRYPVLQKFLHFWETKLEGKLYRVRVATEKLLSPGHYFYASGEFVVQ
jgi:uncharacterized protein Usg